MGKYPLCLVCLLASLIGKAQEGKNEREFRLKESEVPQLILDLMAPYQPLSSKCTYYSETDGEKESYEVKIRLNKKLYSIEFDKDLTLEDIEVDISFAKLPPQVRQQIKAYLTELGKFKIQKTQKQFSTTKAAKSDIIQSVLGRGEAETVRYELEVSIRMNKKWQGYELLFDEKGTYISKREITRRNEDFILYQP